MLSIVMDRVSLIKFTSLRGKEDVDTIFPTFPL